jgi:hypothetical protein
VDEPVDHPWAQRRSFEKYLDPAIGDGDLEGQIQALQ